jgi:hypothetical protein
MDHGSFQHRAAHTIAASTFFFRFEESLLIYPNYLFQNTEPQPHQDEPLSIISVCTPAPKLPPHEHTHTHTKEHLDFPRPIIRLDDNYGVAFLFGFELTKSSTLTLFVSYGR